MTLRWVCVWVCLKYSHRWASGGLAIRVLVQDDGKWSSEREVNTRVMVISGDNQGELQRPDSLQRTPCERLLNVRRLPTPGSSTRTRDRFVGMAPLKVSGKWWVKNVLGIDPGPYLRSVPIPVEEILQNSSPAPRVKNLLNLICLLAVDDEARGTMVPASSRSSVLLGATAALSKETWKMGEIWCWGGKAKRLETGVIY